MSRKRWILFSCVVLVVIVTIVFAVLYFKQQSTLISINDQSKLFNLNYSQSALLEKYLNEWGAFSEKGVYSRKDNKYYTVKRIVIELTDKPQSTYIFTSDRKNNVQLMSMDSTIDKGVWIITVYINPVFANQVSLKKINATLLLGLIQIIYFSTHPLLDPSNQASDVDRYISTFYKENSASIINVTLSK